MDLTQAEAVADLIHSKTEASRKAAMVQLEGRLSKWIYSIRDRLIHVCVLLEVELDFSEEDIQFASRRDIEILIDEMILDTRKLVASFDRGRVCREGLRIALIGKPNVGKSSLLNRLLEKERAIVTEIPGTTRDTVEDILDIGGMMCHITDTAGIRDTSDPIEIEGVRRANRALESADLVLLVLDKSMVMDKEDEALIVRTLDLKKNAFCIVNKIDAMPAWQIDTLKPLIEKMQLYEVSALKDTGIPLLVSAIETAVRFESPPDIGDIFLTNIRHRDCLLKLGKNLQEAASSIKKGMSQEFIVVDLMGALETVGEITGDSAGDDVLNRIFSSFCIGK
jgi:tRNA modification GTPase